MFHSTYIEGDVSREKIDEYLELTGLSIFEDDVIIAKDKFKASGIWIMKNGIFQNPVNDKKELCLTSEYNDDTTDAFTKWWFIIKSQETTYITLLNNDDRVFKNLGNYLPAGCKATFKYQNGYFDTSISVEFPNGDIVIFDTDKGDDYRTIEDYYEIINI